MPSGIYPRTAEHNRKISEANKKEGGRNNEKPVFNPWNESQVKRTGQRLSQRSGKRTNGSALL